jgi:PilZ domain
VERRKQPRLRVTQSVTLLALGSRKCVIEACVLDVSTSGVQVRSPTRLTCATRVEIEGNDGPMLGTVCHCEAHDGAYRIGIQLSDPMAQWNTTFAAHLSHISFLCTDKTIVERWSKRLWCWEGYSFAQRQILAPKKYDSYLRSERKICGAPKRIPGSPWPLE